MVRLGRAMAGAYRHGALGYAKGAAYSALLAFFPVLTTTTALLVQMNAEAVSRRITALLFRAAPPGVEELIRYYVAQRGERPLALPIAASVLALWAASGAMVSLMEAFDAAYGKTNARGVVMTRLVALWLVLVALLPVVGATALMIFGDRAVNWALHWLGVLEAGSALRGGVRLLGALFRHLLASGSIVVVAALLYRFGPPTGRRRPIWPGALLAAALWFLLTAAFAWYVRNIADYNVFYGSIGAVIALCVWMYLLALTAILGCEFNANSGKA
ncbi:MAG: YihY/virulence factor BrkB family protein [Bryobacteraceae bacterium]